MRRLEIGPGRHRIEGFETLDIQPGPDVDHVGDARRLPFADGTFGLVYASHVIEHILWDQGAAAIREWARVLRPGGVLEVWTPDGGKILRWWLTLIETGEWTGPKIGPWQHERIEGDPHRWCNGRLFCYPKAGLDFRDPFLHHASYNVPSLTAIFTAAGLVDVRVMDESEYRGKGHRGINLGVRGVKP